MTEFFSFYSIIIVLLLITIPPITNQIIKCTDITDCFKCTITSQCIWQNAICIEDSESLKLSYLEWYDILPQYCSDDHSLSLMEEYCTDVNSNVIPLTAKINLKDNGTYAIDTLFCKWSISFEKSEAITYDFSLYQRNQTNYYHKIKFRNQTNSNGKLFRTSSKSIEDVMSIEFLYYSTLVLLEEDPFTFTISYKPSIFASKEFIICLACLGSLVLIFLIVGIIAVFYKKRVLAQQERSSRTRQMQIEEGRAKEALKLQRNKSILKSILDKNSSFRVDTTQICTICFEHFKGKVTTLVCSHIFHYHCIEEWCLRSIVNPKCPCCNYEVLGEKMMPNKKMSHLEETNNDNFLTNTTIRVTNFNTMNTASNLAFANDHMRFESNAQLRPVNR